MQARYLQDSLLPEVVPPQAFNKFGEVLEFPVAEKELPLEHKFQVGDRIITKSFQGNANRPWMPIGKQAVISGYADRSYLLSFDGKQNICYWEQEDLELYVEPQELPLEHKFQVGDRVRHRHFKHLQGEIYDTDYRSNPEWFYVAWDEEENKLAAPYHVSDLELEAPINVLGDSSENIYSEAFELHDRLTQLESKRDFIRASGPIAPSGVWIEYGRVSKLKFRQAYFKSNKAIFPSKRSRGMVKRQYIGEEHSDAVIAAGAMIVRRNQLAILNKEIALIERKLEE